MKAKTMTASLSARLAARFGAGASACGRNGFNHREYVT